MYKTSELLHEESFTKEDILNAALVTHPKASKCNLTEKDLENVLLFEHGSNLTLLEHPIVDEY